MPTFKSPGTSRWLRITMTVSSLLGAAIMAPGQLPSSQAELPKLDKRVKGASLSPLQENAAARLRARIPGVRVDADHVIGSPAWISTLGFLSGTVEQETARQGSIGLSAEDPHRAIKAFIIENSDLFGHGLEVLTNATIKDEFVTTHNGMRTVTWQQQLDGIRVFEGLLIGHITRNGELVNLSSHFVHDRLYELGFTEGARNFQQNNFGRGGLGNDAVLADAQDATSLPKTHPYFQNHRNNARFHTTSDGSPGSRMEMFLWDGPNPDRDGDLDAEIILHEYTHGLSNRRVGGGVRIDWQLYPQAGGLGEGWSDFYALSLLSEQTDDVHASFPLAGYVGYLRWPGFIQNYYYGLRRYPCTTQMEGGDENVNPLSFRDIDPTYAEDRPSIPLPPDGPPRNTLRDNRADQVHNMGEVWCVALWEARANLIDRYGYAVGNELILQLVTDGMNLSPANPTFIQARDAILQADAVNTFGQNHFDLWQAFARRGMGYGATAPASTTTVGVVESFAMPPIVRISAVNWVFPPYVDESYSSWLSFRLSRTGPTTPPLFPVTFYLGGSDWGDAQYPDDFTTLGCSQAPFPNAFYTTIPAGQDHTDVGIAIEDDDESEWVAERVSPRIAFVPSSWGYVVDPDVMELQLYIVDND